LLNKEEIFSKQKLDLEESKIKEGRSHHLYLVVNFFNLFMKNSYLIPKVTTPNTKFGVTSSLSQYC
jgi:hypothetical protein